MIRDIAIIVMAVMVTAAARSTGAKIFFADEAHFQADADLRGKWVLKEEPALVDSTSPRRGEKASYYSGGVPGDRGGGGDGTDGQQQRCHRNHLPAATAGAAYRTADGDLGQFDSPPGRQPGGPRRRNRRVGGRPQRLRVDFQHPHRALFLRRGRGKEEVDEALGDSFSGVLVSDSYAAYHHYDGLKQRCWAHLLWDIHDQRTYTLMMNNRRDGRTPSTDCIPKPKLSPILSHDDGVPHNWHWNGGCWTSVVPVSTTRRRRPPDYPDALNATSGNSLSLWPNRTCQRTTTPPSAACATWSSVARSAAAPARNKAHRAR